MVRVNLVNPKKLADQHLIAEYDEILMLVAYIKRYPEVDGIPEEYCLGEGHMRFFKNKLDYLKKRHELIKKEMKKRNFQVNKTVDLQGFNEKNKGNWIAKKEDLNLIKKRIITKLRLKPTYYRHYGEYKPVTFFIKLLRD
ncbi:hypothetical protein COY27_02820 [Candidatus Woesearchaeota archaeon CG_4_10_14_0_2_um_filter_33_13]|nr:MAG: hypothetical protein COY27_02820 [Candidatus Woesearchaeota archaeon CG_4_10_14_0_2_um_filter_33_13]